MSTQSQSKLELDTRFPSGPWKGYFLQPDLRSGRSWMDLQLVFTEGKMSGEGRDWVGRFIISGRYDTESGKCMWRKRYVGRHDVAYHGNNEGRGIWGIWEITTENRGGFHIWPEQMGDPDLERLSTRLEEPVEAELQPVS